MLKRISLFTLTTALIWNFITIPAQEQTKQHLVIVPGQNGMGGQNLDWVFPQYAFARLKKEPPFVKHTSLTPQEWLSIDFGQQQCQAHLEKVFKRNTLANSQSHIMHCSSQGTATGINFTAKNPAAHKALILESVMLSGNSAILHTVENMHVPFISYIPLSYYWLPYIVKPIFPGYAPAGEQPIFNINKLPKDLPIIILHHMKDPQLSFKDAQGLYAHLISNGHNNVYFIPKDSNDEEHVFLLGEENIAEISVINKILEIHNVLQKDQDILKDHNLNMPIEQIPCIFKKYNQEKEQQEFDSIEYNKIKKRYENIISSKIDIKKYQPEVKQEWIAHFNNVLKKEKRFWYVDLIVKTTLLSLIFYRIMNMMTSDTIFTK